MAVGALNHMVVTAPSGPPDGVTESRLLAGRIQGVGTDAKRERRQVGEAATARSMPPRSRARSWRSMTRFKTR